MVENLDDTQNFAAHDSGTNYSVRLIILYHKQGQTLNDAQKIAAAKALYGTWKSLIVGKGIVDFQGVEPTIAAPVPMRIPFSGTGKSPAGSPSIDHAVIVLGDTADYIAEGVGMSDAQVDSLMKVFV